MHGVRILAPAAARLSGALLVVAMAASVGGCRDEASPGPEQPTRVRVDPEGDGGNQPPAGPRSPARIGSEPLPTWTMPPGVEGAPRAAGAIPTLGAAQGDQLGGAPAPPPGAAGIPVPTPQPTVDLAGSSPALTDPDVLALMAQVDERRLADDVRRLSGFGTRHALSETDDDRTGVGAARDWLFGRFDRLDAGGDRQVLTEFEDFTARIDGKRSKQRNVIATLPGIGLEKRLVYVIAHYDSRGEDALDGEADAPGADDNASGTAALLELARVMSGRSWDATIRFAGFAASETGLAGSSYHAPLAGKMDLPIVAVLDNDTIGAPPAGAADSASDGAPIALTVFSATDDGEASRQLARYAQVVSERYLDAQVEVATSDDRVGDRGDHGPFDDAGFPAVRLSEPGDDTRRLDGPDDTVDGVDSGYLAAVTRLNLAIAANIALAPPPLAAAPTLSVANDRPDSVQVSWDATSSPGVAGFWVLSRSGDSQTYDRAEWAGMGPPYTLTGLDPDGPLSVAVAASDDRGHISLFSPEAKR